VVEDVVAVLDEVAAGLLGTMTWAPASSESMASRKWEVGSVVT
jgi:hypothetical protein